MAKMKSISKLLDRVIICPIEKQLILDDMNESIKITISDLIKKAIKKK